MSPAAIGPVKAMLLDLTPARSPHRYEEFAGSGAANPCGPCLRRFADSPIPV